MAIDRNNSMNLPIPAPGTSGPEYAAALQEALNLIAEHTHASGEGVKVPNNNIVYQQAVDIAGQRLDNVQQLRLQNQVTALVTNGSIINVNGDLVWMNNAGVQVRLTDGGQINLSTVGTIGGDYGQPGIPAAVNYSNATKTFSFTQSAGVAAQLSTGNIAISAQQAGVSPITLSASASTSAYPIILPTAAANNDNKVWGINQAGQATFRDILGTSNQINVSANQAAFTISLPSSISGISTLTSALSLSSTLAVAGNTTLSGTLAVSGLTTFSNNVVPNLNNSRELGSSSLRWSNTYSQLLNVAGASTLTGAVAMSNNATIAGTLGVTGATSLSTLSTSGLATLNSLTVTNASTLNSLSASGNTSVGGTLTVTGVTTLNNSVALGANNSQTLSFNARFNTNLEPSTDNARSIGSAALKLANIHTQSATVYGNQTIAGTLGVTGNTTLGALSTSGTATLNALAVTNTATLNGALVANGNITLGSTNANTISVIGRFSTSLQPNNNNSHALGDSARRWSNTFTQLLNVASASTLTGAVSVGSTLAVTGTTTLSSALTVNSGGATVTGNSSVSGTFTCTNIISGTRLRATGEQVINTAGTINNYNIGTASRIICAGIGNHNFTGFAGGTDGDIIYILAIAGAACQFTFNSGSSSVGNRIRFLIGASPTTPASGAILIKRGNFWYLMGAY